MLPSKTPPSEYVGPENPKDKPHSLRKDPCYVNYQNLVDYTNTNVELKKGTWVVDTRQGNQGKLLKIGRKRGTRGLFGWFECAGKKKIVALKSLVGVPATYEFLQSKLDGKWYKLAPSTTGVMTKMFQVMNPVQLTPATASDGPIASDDNGPIASLASPESRVLRSSAQSEVPAPETVSGGVPLVENLGETPDVSSPPASAPPATTPAAAVPAELPSPATPGTLFVQNVEVHRCT